MTESIQHGDRYDDIKRKGGWVGPYNGEIHGAPNSGYYIYDGQAVKKPVS